MLRAFDDEARFIRLFMAVRGERLTDVARKCDVSAATVSAVAGGKYAPTNKLKRRLVDYYRVEEDLLFAPLRTVLPQLFEVNKYD